MIQRRYDDDELSSVPYAGAFFKRIYEALTDDFSVFNLTLPLAQPHPLFTAHARELYVDYCGGQHVDHGARLKYLKGEEL